MTPDSILTTYDHVADGFDRRRDRTLFERKWLDRLLAHAPGRRVLDLGCGPGRPIAAYLSDRRCEVTGVDGASAMVALFRHNLPRATAVHADMRGLKLKAVFDVILAWNSFFHLSADDQRGMFATFAAHAAPRAVLMFTSGPSEGEAIGEVEGESVFHASLSPDEYRKLMIDAGFAPIAFVPEDPECQGHSIWLARYMG
ncbi:class I SAM-dependent methyltransferase [Aliiroseovarius subalbicans]|uniref:class I SAM-dependent methyltransferase n=1 Tax=Aliiroseovarius subalbicans TaxID=2925840 RepID=UPI001F55C806|nr:class I SAM-dependent methyltransferase [Aliiroseovarius subalbicans]MCI2398549.1 methyltransferase domain-containing protein [Aliiroseovarius subalbicans]